MQKITVNEGIQTATVAAAGKGADFKKGEKQSPLFSHCLPPLADFFYVNAVREKAERRICNLVSLCLLIDKIPPTPDSLPKHKALAQIMHTGISQRARLYICYLLMPVFLHRYIAKAKPSTIPQVMMIPYQAIFSPSIPKRFSIAYRFNSLFSRFSQSTRSIR